jgi:hypothetical protein
MVLWRHSSADGHETTSLGLLDDRIEEARFADPGLAREQQELASAGHNILETSVDQVEQIVPSDEERAADDTKGA